MFSKITVPVRDEFGKFKEFFSSLFDIDDAYMQPLLDYVSNVNGKMVRPLLVLLTARYFGFPGDRVYHAASSVELLHTASLIHDDVVDSSMQRRNKPSVNAEFDNKLAVLLGDYLLSLSIREIARTEMLENIRTMSELSGTLSVGEIFQIGVRNDTTLSEERYFRIIGQKTASLFSYCASISATICGGSAGQVALFGEFGRLAGLAFQIRDDIFDYFKSEETGKPSGNDLREGKFTLPAIHAINSSTLDWSDTVRSIRSGLAIDDDIAKVTEFTVKNGGIEYASQYMEHLARQAEGLLPADMEPTLREAFTSYLQFIIGRNS